MVKPTIVFVPGIWEGPDVYSSLVTTLKSLPHEYPTLSITLPNTGKVSPDNETLQGDVRAIRKQIEPLINAGKEIVLVMHSAGGFLGSNAIEGWSVAKRHAEGKSGGVKKLVYLAGALLPEGTMHSDLPFMEKDGHGRMCPVSPLTTLLAGLSPSVATLWLSKLQCQPAENWNDVVTYAAWKEIPSIYLVADEDKLLPPEVQRKCAAMAGSETEGVAAGHMLILSHEGRCLEAILKAV